MNVKRRIKVNFNELEAPQVSTWEGYVNWRNKPALRGRHGGMLAASFVLVVEILENLAFLANASNLVLYLKQYMHMSPSKSANNVTNFMGTAFLLALLGGFLSDAFFTTYRVYLISAVIEFLLWVGCDMFTRIRESCKVLQVAGRVESNGATKSGPRGRIENVNGVKNT
ncbi:Protein NRT1/ PTR FAMILY 4.7, partial [Mucuna pruriens]